MKNYSELGLSFGEPGTAVWIENNGSRPVPAIHGEFMLRHICLSLGAIEAYEQLESGDPEIIAQIAAEKVLLLELLQRITGKNYPYAQHKYYQAGVSNVLTSVKAEPLV